MTEHLTGGPFRYSSSKSREAVRSRPSPERLVCSLQQTSTHNTAPSFNGAPLMHKPRANSTLSSFYAWLDDCWKVCVT